LRTDARIGISHELLKAEGHVFASPIREINSLIRQVRYQTAPAALFLSASAESSATAPTRTRCIGRIACTCSSRLRSVDDGVVKFSGPVQRCLQPLPPASTPTHRLHIQTDPHSGTYRLAGRHSGRGVSLRPGHPGGLAPLGTSRLAGARQLDNTDRDEASALANTRSQTDQGTFGLSRPSTHFGSPRLPSRYKAHLPENQPGR